MCIIQAWYVSVNNYEKTFRDRGSGLKLIMGLFDFFYGKSLDKEVNKMMSQCDGFLHYAIALSEGAKKELLPCGGASCCTEQTNRVSILKPISDRTNGTGFFTSRDCFSCGFKCIIVV